MRRIFFTILIIEIFSVCASPVKAQISFNINVNLERQPVWGPSGYDYAEYYYLPDIGVYYDVSQQRYYYYEKRHWINTSSLPHRFRNYNLYNSYKIVLNENDPWRNDKIYREKYSSYKNRHDQQSIRDSHDSKYFVNKNDPEHNNWIKQHKHDKGRKK